MFSPKSSGCSRRGGASLRQHPEYAHGFRDVLDRLLAEVLVAQCKLVADLFMHFHGDADAARVGEAFEAGGDVDAVAVYLLAIHHHVAEVHADTKLHSPLGLPCRVFRLERCLDHHGAVNRLHDAGKLRHYAIARRINESPAMLLDEAVDQLAVGGKSAQRRLFILTHEAAIAEDIGAEYGGELTFQHPPRSVTDNRANIVREPLLRLTAAYLEQGPGV